MEVQIARWLVLFLFVWVGTATAADTWTQGYHDAVNTSTSTVSISTTPSPAWSMVGNTTGTADCPHASANYHPDSGAAITTNAIYTSRDKKPGAGDARSEFMRLDHAGNIVWTYDSCVDGAKHDGLVTIDAVNNTVIWPAHDGMLRASDLTTGALKWAFYVADAYPSPGPTEAGPTLDSGKLYYLGQIEMLALDPATLVTNATDCPTTPTTCPTVLWRVSRYVSGAAHGAAFKPAVFGNAVYWGGYQEFGANNATTGATIWHRSTSAWSGTSEVLTGWTYGFGVSHYYNGVVYTAAAWATDQTQQTLVTAYDAATGAAIWEVKPSIDFISKHVLDTARGLLTGGYGTNTNAVQGGMIAFHLSDGTIAWQTPWPRVVNVAAVTTADGLGVWGATGTYGYEVSAIVSSDDKATSVEITSVVASTADSKTLTWDAFANATGYRVYRTATPGTYSNGSLLATLGAVTTYLDHGAAGSGTNKPAAPSFTNGVPALAANGRVVASESSGTVHMLDAATGAILWSYTGGASMHGSTSLGTVGGVTSFIVPSNDTLRVFTATVPATISGKVTLGGKVAVQ